MYNIKGPSKIVAKTARRGNNSTNIDGFRDTLKSSKSLDANDNEVVNGPKPVFHNNSKRMLSNHARQQEVITPQHEEIIKYIHESWLSVNAGIDDENSNGSRSRRGSSVVYYEDGPCPHLQDFKPFDLESWWGKRLYNLITNSVNGKD